jgi:hypothetical protein
MSQGNQSFRDDPPRRVPRYSGPRGVAARRRLILGVMAMLVAAPAASAADVYSNGVGGGDWSDPGSWREKAVPTAQDQVVISRGDVIEFDRNDDGKTTCQQIFIDPKGTLGFKHGSGRTVCRVAGQVESYGAIKIDGSRSAADHFELQLMGSPSERTVKLLKNASLMVTGRHNQPHGKHNVVIAAPAVDGQEPFCATIEGGAVSTIDLRGAELINIELRATDIDNTGAKANERLNVADNHFTGVSHLTIRNCDSPAIVGNLFEATAAPGSAAITIEGSALAEIRGNGVRGRYTVGIDGRKQVDSAVIENVIEKCDVGIIWRGTNVMIKQLAVRECDMGVHLVGATGVLEDFRIERCKQAYVHEESETQLTNAQITDVPKGGEAVGFRSGSITLLNCNLKPEQISLSKLPKTSKKGSVVAVQCLAYLVAHVQGRAPTGAVIDLRTAGAAPGAADPNVRNSPAKILPSGLTPLPASLQPLIVKSWALERSGETIPAPRYTLSITPPVAPMKDSSPKNAPPKEAKPTEAKPIVSLVVTPDDSWFRADPNAPNPTLEVKLP